MTDLFDIGNEISEDNSTFTDTDPQQPDSSSTPTTTPAEAGGTDYASAIAALREDQRKQQESTTQAIGTLASVIQQVMQAGQQPQQEAAIDPQQFANEVMEKGPEPILRLIQQENATYQQKTNQAITELTSVVKNLATFIQYPDLKATLTKNEKLTQELAALHNNDPLKIYASIKAMEKHTTPAQRQNKTSNAERPGQAGTGKSQKVYTDFGEAIDDTIQEIRNIKPF